MSPLTVLLTDEQLKLKQRQIKEKAPPPGAAKILTRARKEQKKQQQTENQSPITANKTQSPPAQKQPQNISNTFEANPKPEQKPASKPQTTKQPPEETTAKSKPSQSMQANANGTNRSRIDTDYKTNSRNSDDEWQNLLEDQTPGLAKVSRLETNMFVNRLFFKKKRTRKYTISS
jgi:hypothetical protein